MSTTESAPQGAKHPQYKAYLQTHFGEMSIRELAFRTGTSKTTVRKHLRMRLEGNPKAIHSLAGKKAWKLIGKLRGPARTEFKLYLESHATGINDEYVKTRWGLEPHEIQYFLKRWKLV